MQFKHATLEFDGHVAILTLDHQEVMNAVSMDMLAGLGEALDEIEERKAEVRCLVITGAGRAFCTGANLQGRNNNVTKKAGAGSSLEIGFHPFLRRLRRLHCPIVSAVNVVVGMVPPGVGCPATSAPGHPRLFPARRRRAR